MAKSFSEHLTSAENKNLENLLPFPSLELRPRPDQFLYLVLY